MATSCGLFLATIYNQSQLAERKHVARYWLISTAATAVPLSAYPSPLVITTKLAAAILGGGGCSEEVFCRPSTAPVLTTHELRRLNTIPSATETSVAALHQGAPGQMTWLENSSPWLKPWLRHSPAYCFASVIVWTENKNVNISDRFICFILTVKRALSTCVLRATNKKGRRLFLRKKCIRVT